MSSRSSLQLDLLPSCLLSNCCSLFFLQSLYSPTPMVPSSVFSPMCGCFASAIFQIHCSSSSISLSFLLSPVPTCCPFISCPRKLINLSQIHPISSFSVLKQVQLSSPSLFVILHSPQNVSFAHTFLVPFPPSQAAPASCPRPPTSAVQALLRYLYFVFFSQDSISALFHTLPPLNRRFFPQSNPTSPSFLQLLIQPGTEQEDLFPLCPPPSHTSPYSPCFFSLTSNSPFLNHPPSSPSTSQLLCLSPLSRQCHLALIFSLLFFFPPLPSSFLHTQVNLQGHLGPECIGRQSRRRKGFLLSLLSLARGLRSGNVHGSHSPELQHVQLLCSWHVDSPIGLLQGALLCSWERHSLEILAVKLW
ncbi:uncharacterized protein LOC129783815 [Falco peregrinus]|uniref:uncharacterized protein LOC129783815 n=1 Tax=Falco peregrinus TaxID=8954 RepID=UPI002478BF65|nr:uncharacterized protein LOC129783815 [Falco peregrinus]XP_055651636.1 uncharacterized protein LOC129783815 [Falco peregrinus]